MNTRLQNIVLLTLTLGASNIEAYKYSITNRTKEKHAIGMQLCSVGRIDQIGDVESGQTIEKNYDGFSAGDCLRTIIVDGKPMTPERDYKDMRFELVEDNGTLRIKRIK